jgi:hypothetical protein
MILPRRRRLDPRMCRREAEPSRDSGTGVTVPDGGSGSALVGSSLFTWESCPGPYGDWKVIGSDRTATLQVESQLPGRIGHPWGREDKTRGIPAARSSKQHSLFHFPGWLRLLDLRLSRVQFGKAPRKNGGRFESAASSSGVNLAANRAPSPFRDTDTLDDMRGLSTSDRHSGQSAKDLDSHPEEVDACVTQSPARGRRIAAESSTFWTKVHFRNPGQPRNALEGAASA